MLRVPAKPLWRRHRSLRRQDSSQVAFGEAAPARKNGTRNQNPPRAKSQEHRQILRFVPGRSIRLYNFGNLQEEITHGIA